MTDKLSECTDEGEALLCMTLMEACKLVATECPGLKVTVDAVCDLETAASVSERLAKRGYTSDPPAFPYDKECAIRHDDPYADASLLVERSQERIPELPGIELHELAVEERQTTHLVAEIRHTDLHLAAGLIGSDFGLSLLRLMQHYIEHRLLDRPVSVRLFFDGRKDPKNARMFLGVDDKDEPFAFSELVDYFFFHWGGQGVGHYLWQRMVADGVAVEPPRRLVRSGLFAPSHPPGDHLDLAGGARGVLYIDVFDESFGFADGELLALYRAKLGPTMTQHPVQFPLNAATLALNRRTPPMTTAAVKGVQSDVYKTQRWLVALNNETGERRGYYYSCHNKAGISTQSYRGDPLFGLLEATEALRCAVKQARTQNFPSTWDLRVVVLPASANFASKEMRSDLEAHLRADPNEFLFVVDPRLGSAASVQLRAMIGARETPLCSKLDNFDSGIQTVQLAGLCGLRMLPWPLDAWPARLLLRSSPEHAFRWVVVLCAPDDALAVQALVMAFRGYALPMEAQLAVCVVQPAALPQIAALLEGPLVEAQDLRVVDATDRWYDEVEGLPGTLVALEPQITGNGPGSLLRVPPGYGFVQADIRRFPLAGELVQFAWHLEMAMQLRENQ